MGGVGLLMPLLACGAKASPSEFCLFTNLDKIFGFLLLEKVKNKVGLWMPYATSLSPLASQS